MIDICKNVIGDEIMVCGETLVLSPEHNNASCIGCFFYRDGKTHCTDIVTGCIAGCDNERPTWVILKKVDNSLNQHKSGGSTPSQYGLPSNAQDLQDLIEYRKMNFAVGNIFKACYRLGIKGYAEYDLNKIIWFANRELERVKQENKSS